MKPKTSLTITHTHTHTQRLTNQIATNGKADQSKHILGKRENNFHIKPAWTNRKSFKDARESSSLIEYAINHTLWHICSLMNAISWKQNTYITRMWEQNKWIKNYLSSWTYLFIYLRNTLTRKSGNHLHAKHWTAVSTFSGLISNAHRDLHHWRSNQQPQYAKANTLPLGHWFKTHISNAELTSELRDHFDLICLEGTYSLKRIGHPRGYVFPSQSYESS